MGGLASGGLRLWAGVEAEDGDLSQSAYAAQITAYWGRRTRLCETRGLAGWNSAVQRSSIN